MDLTRDKVKVMLAYAYMLIALLSGIFLLAASKG
jgi:hypothetical protein